MSFAMVERGSDKWWSAVEREFSKIVVDGDAPKVANIAFALRKGAKMSEEFWSRVKRVAKNSASKLDEHDKRLFLDAFVEKEGKESEMVSLLK